MDVLVLYIFWSFQCGDSVRAWLTALKAQALRKSFVKLDLVNSIIKKAQLCKELQWFLSAGSL